MLAHAQVKVLDFLEYTLKVIEDYDQGYSEESKSEPKLAKSKLIERKSFEAKDRLDVIKTTSQKLALYHTKKWCDFVTSSKPYKFADSYIDFHTQYSRILDTSSTIYKWLNSQVVLPLAKNVKLFIDFTSGKISLLVDFATKSYVIQNLVKICNAAKVSAIDNFWKLDLNEDGQVTLDDFYLMVKTIKQALENTTVSAKLTNLKYEVFQRALNYLDYREEQEEEKPLASIGDDYHDTSADSFELQPLGEQTD